MIEITKGFKEHTKFFRDLFIENNYGEFKNFENINEPHILEMNNTISPVIIDFIDVINNKN